jgi:hypothetical protein
MLIDPDTALRVANTHLEDLRRDAAAHRRLPTRVPAWRRTTGRLLHRAAHALLATPRAGAPTHTPCDDTPVTAV